MRLPDSARIAVIGAGPGGLTAAKHAIEAGFEVQVFEASEQLGGQWHTTATHSGVWPGMRTNTSRAMTAFSDFAVPSEHDLHPQAEQVHSYLHAYATAFGVTERIRFGEPVQRVEPDWTVNREPFDAVIVASGRFRSPRLPEVVEHFDGEVIHSFDYPGAIHFRDRRTMVVGNGVSGHEIATDLSAHTPVLSAHRKPKYVLPKVVEGVPSDWQWYTHVGGLRRATMERSDFSRLLRRRVLEVAGNPADFGAPAPDPDILIAGQSLCQDYLGRVRSGDILCRPGIAAIDGRLVTFTDGSTESVDSIICATGYHLDIPYLSDEVGSIIGPGPNTYLRSLHPDLPRLGLIGQFAVHGPVFPLLELQARLIIGIWSGQIAPPDEDQMRTATTQPPPPVDAHDTLALALSHAAGVAPDLRARPALTEPLLFGPMLPARYRLDGPGAQTNAVRNYVEALASSPRPAVYSDDVAALDAFGLSDLAEFV